MFPPFVCYGETALSLVRARYMYGILHAHVCVGFYGASRLLAVAFSLRVTLSSV